MSEKDQLLAELLEDYHRRRALGETPRIQEYERQAGENFGEMREILEAESALDDALAEEERQRFPHPFCEYTLLRELGRGAVGVVYEAVHRGLGRTVALKVLQSGFDTHKKAIGRFQREARACAQVRHDHIVEVYEAGECQGRHFYAMALIEGQPLSQLVKEGDVPGPRELAGAIAGVADALSALNDAGIVHRDIKPSNIVLEANGRMVLADFGLARTVASESLTQTGEALGTPAYMSPEQLLGQQSEVDGRTDVYGLGAALYEVLAGRPVFKADDIAGLMRMILSERPQHLREVKPDLPAGIGRIVMKALEKRKEDRYQSAAEMRDDLLAYAGGGRVVGRPVSKGRHIVRSLKRNKWWLGAAAAVLVAAVALYKPPTLPPAKPGMLKIASVPAAELRVGDADHGRTPQKIEVKAGEYRVLLAREGFLSREETVKVGADAETRLELLLQPKDPSDPIALATLARGLDVSIEEVTKRNRAGYDPENDPHGFHLWPQGMLLPADDKYRVAIGDLFEGDGQLVFRLASGKELAREELPDLSPDERVWPDAVKTALENGETVRWGYEPGAAAEFGDRPVVATVSWAQKEVRDRVEKLGNRMATLDEKTQRQLMAQACLAETLWASAYREAAAVAKTGPTRLAVDAMMIAVERMLPNADNTPFGVPAKYRTAVGR